MVAAAVATCLALLAFGVDPAAASGGLKGVLKGNNAVLIPAAAGLFVLARRALAVRDWRIRRWAGGLAVLFALWETLGRLLAAFDNLSGLAKPRRLAACGLFAAGWAVAAYLVLVVVLAWAVAHRRPAAGGRPLAGHHPAARVWRFRCWAGGQYRGHRRRSLLAAWGVLCLARLPYLAWAWPGVVTNDSAWQLRQAFGIDPWTSHHPFAHTLAIKAVVVPVEAVTGSTAAGIGVFSLLQIAATSAVVVHVTSRLLAWGVNRWLAAAGYLFALAWPVAGMFAVTMWKDIPFANAVLLLTTLLVDVWRQPRQYLARPARLVGLALVVAAVYVLRNNGPYVVIPALAVAVAGARGARLRLAAAGLAGLAAAVAFTGPVASAAGVAPGSTAEALSVPMQQMARVARDHPDQLTPAEVAFIEGLWPDLTVAEVGALYKPWIADPVKEQISRDQIEGDLTGFVSNWFELGQRFPGTYVESFLAGSYGYWYPDTDYTVVIPMVTQGTPGMAWQPPAAGGIGAYAVNLLFRPHVVPVLSWFYSPGLGWQVLLVAGAALWLRRPKRYLGLLVAPGLVWLTCLASPVYAEFRYAYGYLITLPVVAAVAFSHWCEPAGTASIPVARRSL